MLTIPHAGVVPDLQLPPRDQLEGLPVAKAADEYTAAVAEFHAAAWEASHLSAEAATVDQEDRAKTAAAIAQGKTPTPGKAQEAHQAKIDRATRLADARATLALSAHAALVAALRGTEGAESQKGALERHEANRRTLLGLVEDVEAALQALDVTAALTEFFRGAQDDTKVTVDGSTRAYSAPRPAVGRQLVGELRGYHLIDGEDLRVLPSEPANLALTRTIIDARSGVQGEDRARFVEWMSRTFDAPAPGYAGDWAEWLIDRGLTQSEAVAWATRGARPERRADRVRPVVAVA